MAYPRAAGSPDYTGNYIPEIWDPRIQVRFYKKSVTWAICNTMYEGEIKKYGDTVNIRTYPDISVSTYSKNMELSTQIPDSSKVQMLIDEGKYFQVQVDDVDEIQSDVKLLNVWTDTAAEQLKEEIDKTVVQGIYNDANSSNKGATAGNDSSAFNLGASGAPVPLTKVNIIDYITDVGTVLDEQSVPDSERWMVLPPVFCNLIPKSDLKDASLSGDSVSPLRNGNLGTIANMTIHVSRQLYSTTDTGDTVWYCLAGHPIAVSFAAQLSKTEEIRSEHSFATKVRGLEVFGYKTTKDTALACLYAKVG